MNIQRYLERIDYHGSLEPTLQTLRALHEAHLLAVPFENLDIHLGREIVLDEAFLWTKIVEHNRGGFCYELNGLFALLLRALGFRVDLLSAAVANASGRFGPEFDHLTLLVHLEQDWVADVGFGESFRQPLRLQAGLIQRQDEGSYLTATCVERLCRHVPLSTNLSSVAFYPATGLFPGKTHGEGHLERSAPDDDHRQ